MEQQEWIDFSKIMNSNATEQFPITLHIGHHYHRMTAKQKTPPPSTQFTSIESIHESIPTFPSPKHNRTNNHMKIDKKQKNQFQIDFNGRPRILSVREIKYKQKKSHQKRLKSRQPSSGAFQPQSKNNHRRKLSLCKHVS